MTAPVRTFGKYILDVQIARGGMARVFLARLRGLGGFEKQLVVKQVLPELASDPRFVSMFVQEAKTLVRMSHPHIAPVYELGAVDGVYFLAMEYVQGATLSQMLDRGPLAPELVAHLGSQLCDALHYAHDRFSIVHRDVTPRNVIVDEQGHARLLDFGIAAPVATEEGDGLFGTPGYMSPEQASGAAVGPKSDVFSLGTVLFEALTARRAFDVQTAEQAREALSREGPAFTAEDQVPEALATIVNDALTREPEGRPTSARELGRALRSWAARHAPEGVGPELGERARAARTVHQEERVAPADAQEPDREPEVRTLATSPALNALLGPAAAIDAPCDEAPPEARPAPAGPGSGPNTVAIQRAPARKKTPPAPTAVSATGRPLAGWGGPAAALLLGAAALGWWFWPAAAVEVHRPPGSRPETHAAAGQTEPNPAPDPAPHEPTETEPTETEPTETEPTETEPTRAPPAGVAQRGAATLTVNALPWAEVILDGRYLGRTPLRGRAIVPGLHNLLLRNPNLGRPARARFEVPRGGSITLIGDLERGAIVRP